MGSYRIGLCMGYNRRSWGIRDVKGVVFVEGRFVEGGVVEEEECKAR